MTSNKMKITLIEVCRRENSKCVYLQKDERETTIIYLNIRHSGLIWSTIIKFNRVMEYFQVAKRCTEKDR